MADGSRKNAEYPKHLNWIKILINTEERAKLVIINDQITKNKKTLNTKEANKIYYAINKAVPRKNAKFYVYIALAIADLKHYTKAKHGRDNLCTTAG